MNLNQIRYIIIILFIAIVIGKVTGYSELKPFETQVTVKLTTDGYCEVTTEEQTYSYVCNSSSTNRIGIDFYRNVSCNTQYVEDMLVENRDMIRTLSLGLNDSTKYYDKYLDCYASERLCRDKVSINSSVNYQDKYTSCFEDFNNCKSEKSPLVIARQNAEASLSTCEADKKKAEDAKMVYAVVGGCIGLGLGYFWWGKAKRPAISSAEAQLPKSR